jgi:hypothetical protein
MVANLDATRLASRALRVPPGARPRRVTSRCRASPSSGRCLALGEVDKWIRSALNGAKRSLGGSGRRTQAPRLSCGAWGIAVGCTARSSRGGRSGSSWLATRPPSCMSASGIGIATACVRGCCRPGPLDRQNLTEYCTRPRGSSRATRFWLEHSGSLGARTVQHASVGKALGSVSR